MRPGASWGAVFFVQLIRKAKTEETPTDRRLVAAKYCEIITDVQGAQDNFRAPGALAQTTTNPEREPHPPEMGPYPK